MKSIDMNRYEKYEVSFEDIKLLKNDVWRYQSDWWRHQILFVTRERNSATYSANDSFNSTRSSINRVDQAFWIEYVFDSSAHSLMKLIPSAGITCSSCVNSVRAEHQSWCENSSFIPSAFRSGCNVCMSEISCLFWKKSAQMLWYKPALPVDRTTKLLWNLCS